MHLSVVASPDIARAARSLAEQARADEVKADGRRLAVEVLARDAHKVAEALAAGLQPVPGGATGLYDTTLASYKEARSTLCEGEVQRPGDHSPTAPTRTRTASRGAASSRS